MIYLGDLSPSHAADEATHFLRHITANYDDDPQNLVDAFYARCIEEALGYLGSKLIYPQRTCNRIKDLTSIARSKYTSPHHRKAAQLTLQHVRWENNQRKGIPKGIYQSHHEIFNATTHLLGYLLGERLYQCLMRGSVSRTDIRDLFFEDLEAMGNARLTYLFLIKRAEKIPFPGDLE